MKILTFIACMLFALPVYAQSFFNTLPDVPLMTGLHELEGRAFSFDKPEGRILVGAALMDRSIEVKDVQTYYNRALPQFGWVSTGPFQYIRGGESLEISVAASDKGKDDQRVLEITITP